MNKVIGVTGNRTLVHSVKAIESELEKKFSVHLPSLVITGMAIGFDQIVAKYCIKNEIPFLAAIPYVNQSELWSWQQQQEYIAILEKATEIKIVSDGDYAVWKLHKRNEWIVDNSELLIAYSTKNSGGTFECCEYASNKSKSVIKLFSENAEFLPIV